MIDCVLKDVDSLCTYISREHKREHGKNPVVQYLYFSIIVIYILSRLAVLSLLKDTILKTSDQFWQEPCEIHSVNVLFFKRDYHYDNDSLSIISTTGDDLVAEYLFSIIIIIGFTLSQNRIFTELLPKLIIGVDNCVQLQK